jgi:hypothetical protein
MAAIGFLCVCIKPSSFDINRIAKSDPA